MNEERLDELLEFALRTGALPDDATDDERAELEPLLGAANTIDESAASLATEAAATMPIARARFERFIAAESAPVPAREVAPQASRGWIGRVFGSMRPLAATGVAAAVVVLVVVAFVGGDLIGSGTSTALALEVDPGDYLQVEGVVTEVTEGEDGPRIRLETEAGFIELDLSVDTSVLHDARAMGIRDVRVGQRLSVAGLVNEQRRVRAAVLSVRAEDGDAPQKVQVDEAKNLGDSFVGDIVAVRFDKTQRSGTVLVRLPDGKVTKFVLEGAQLAGFISGQGFGPGASVRLTHTGDGFVIAPIERAGDRCELPPGTLDRLGQETICGILLAQEGLNLTLRTIDGVIELKLVRDAHIQVSEASGVTLQEVLEQGGAIGHGILVTGHKRGDVFIVGIVIVGPVVELPPDRDDSRPPPSDRR